MPENTQKQIENINQLVEVLVDTTDMYQQTIRHRFNSLVTGIIGFAELEKYDNASFNKEPFDDLFKAYKQFRDSTTAYSALLMEYKNGLQPIPEQVNKEELTKILTKYQNDLNLVSTKGKSDEEKRLNAVLDVISNSMDGSNEFRISLPFIDQLRGNSYNIPCTEEEIRTQVLRELGGLSEDLKSKCIPAFGQARISKNEDLIKYTKQFYDLVAGLPQLNYALDQTFPGSRYISLTNLPS